MYLLREWRQIPHHIEIALQTTLVGGANQKNILESENARHEVGDITTPHHSEQPELCDDLVQQRGATQTPSKAQ